MAAGAALAVTRTPTAAEAQAVFVDTTTDQIIGGVKTFTAAPVVPAGAFPQTAVAGLPGTFAQTQVAGTPMVAANVNGPFAPTTIGAAAQTRYVGGTTGGSPTSGTFSVGDFVVDRTGKLWICTTGGTPGTWVQQVGVDTTTDQIIGGVKTFTAAPVVPAGAFPQTAVAGLPGTFAQTQVAGTPMVAANVNGPFAPTTIGAAAQTRYVGGTTGGSPTSGTFSVGDFVVDRTGKLWICTAEGTPGTWVQQSGVDITTDQIIGGVKTFTAAPVVPAGAFPQTAVAGLPGTFAQTQVAGTPMVAANVNGPFAPTTIGAAAQTRYVGGTTGGSPTSGTFSVGDFVVDRTGKLWICTAEGTPGTWVQQSGVDITTDQIIGGVKTFTAAPVVPAGAFPQTAVAGLVADLAAKQDAFPSGTYVAAVVKQVGGATTEVFRYEPTDDEAGAFSLSFGRASFAGVNEASAFLGFNTEGTGAAVDPTKSTFHVGYEANYNEGGTLKMEWYLQMGHPGGLVTRPFFANYNKSSGRTENVILQADNIYMNDSDNVQRFKLYKNGANTDLELSVGSQASSVGIALRAGGATKWQLYRPDSTDVLYLYNSVNRRWVMAFALGATSLTSVTYFRTILQFHDPTLFQDTAGPSNTTPALPRTPAKYLKIRDATNTVYLVPAYAVT